jgi:hypothetical protein
MEIKKVYDELAILKNKVDSLDDTLLLDKVIDWLYALENNLVVVHDSNELSQELTVGLKEYDHENGAFIIRTHK